MNLRRETCQDCGRDLKDVAAEQPKASATAEAKGGSLHRACSTCSFYEEEFCKRRAPEVIYEQFGPLMPKRKTVWPITGPKDWCGEYEAR